MQELHQACVCFCDVLQHLVCNAKAPQPAQFPLLVGALEGFQLGIHLENMYFIISARHPPGEHILYHISLASTWRTYTLSYQLGIHLNEGTRENIHVASSRVAEHLQQAPQRLDGTFPPPGEPASGPPAL